MGQWATNWRRRRAAVSLMSLCAFAFGALTDASAAVGGPDTAGYTYIDSTEAGGPTYNFEDLSSNWTQVALTTNQVSSAVPIGFAFPFYGETYSSLYISSNSFLTFLSGQSSQPSPNPIPNDFDSTHGFIAGWQGSWAASFGGTIHYALRGTPGSRVFYVQFTDIPHAYDTSTKHTVQFKLFEGTGIIEAHYQAAPAYSSFNFLAGIENQNGSTGLQYHYGTSALPTPLAVRYVPPPPYTISDGNTPGGPTYTFEDISGSGWSVVLGDDEVSSPIPIGYPSPFPFLFFDEVFSETSISSNGFLTFLDSQPSIYIPPPMPSPLEPNGVIAGWWGDFDPTLGGSIHYETRGTAPSRRFIVQFSGIPHYSGGNPQTLQYKLFEGSNHIEVHYQHAPSDGTFHVAGLEDAAGLRSVVHYQGTAALADNSVVRYAGRPRAVTGYDVSVDPAPGAVLSGGGQYFDITFAEPVQEFDKADLLLEGAAVGPETYVHEPFAVDETTWRIAVIGLEDGALTIQLDGSGFGPADEAYNPNAPYPTFFDAWSYTVENAAIIFGAPLDTDPGWARSGQWEFGQPQGLGGGPSRGNPDPAAGATGSNVLGVNLAGDYLNVAAGPHYVTTGPIDCSGHTQVELAYFRWLNTDYQPYASTMVEVSNDGVNWTRVWENDDLGFITDSAWMPMAHDITAIAAGESAVYVRWGYETTTDVYAFSGWNIDDIALRSTGQVSPLSLLNVTVEANGVVLVTFSGPAGVGALVPGAYWISGAGAGDLSNHPDRVEQVAPDQFRLYWDAGTMVSGGAVTIGVENIYDADGLRINGTLSGTDVDGAFGTIYHEPMDGDPGWPHWGGWSWHADLEDTFNNPPSWPLSTPEGTYAWAMEFSDYYYFTPGYDERSCEFSTHPIDCSTANSVWLSFWEWRYLAVTGFGFGSVDCRATVTVTTSAMPETVVWTGTMRSLDWNPSWEHAELDISALAAGDPEVVITWRFDNFTYQDFTPNTDFFDAYWLVDEVRLESRGVPGLQVYDVDVTSPQSVLVHFVGEPTVGAVDPQNYTASGDGLGSLSVHPSSVVYQDTYDVGGVTYTVYALSWNTGLMAADGTLRIDVSGLEDANGVRLGYPNWGADNTGPPPPNYPDIAITTPNPTASHPIEATITWDRGVQGFLAADVTVTNGSIVGFTGSGNAQFFIEVQPWDPGIVTIDIAAGVAEDTAGNPTDAAQSPASIQYTGPATTTLPNDGFAQATLLSGAAVQVSGAWNVHATAELGEPQHGGIAGGASVWWAWRAPMSGTVFLETQGSSFDTLLAVYTGTAPNYLVPQAANDNAGPDALHSTLSFDAIAGELYFFAVDGVGGAMGRIDLEVRQPSGFSIPVDDDSNSPGETDLYQHYNTYYGSAFTSTNAMSNRQTVLSLHDLVTNNSGSIHVVSADPGVSALLGWYPDSGAPPAGDPSQGGYGTNGDYHHVASMPDDVYGAFDPEYDYSCCTEADGVQAGLYLHRQDTGETFHSHADWNAGGEPRFVAYLGDTFDCENCSGQGYRFQRVLVGIELDGGPGGWDYNDIVLEVVVDATYMYPKFPVADAGPDQPNRLPGDTVTVDGGGSWSPNSITGYAWRFLSVPEGSAAVSTWRFQTSEIAQFDIDKHGQYVVELAVSDSSGGTERDTCVISTVNRAPTAQVTAPGTAFVADVVTLDGAGSQDPDGQAISFDWVVVSAPPGSSAGLLEAYWARPRFQPDVAGTYTFEMIVSDGSMSASTQAVVDVLARDPGQVVYVDQTYTGAEDGSESAPYTRVGPAVTALGPGGTLRIAPGNYGEPLRLGSGHQAMRLERDAVRPGFVRIGYGPISKRQGAAHADDSLNRHAAVQAALADAFANLLTRHLVDGAASDTPALHLDAHTFEPYLPRMQWAPGIQVARRGLPIAIRLRPGSALAESMVHAQLEPLGTEGAWWVLEAAQDGAEANDWWLVFRPAASWDLGTVLTPQITLGPGTGEPLGAAQFYVGGDAGAEAVDPLWQPEPERDFDASGFPADAFRAEAVAVREATGVPEAMRWSGMVSAAYEIGPDQVFTEPQRVWLPLPQDQAWPDVALYYFKPHGDDRGWYPADHVEGWLVPGSHLTLDLGGARYLGIQVRHGGTCALGTPADAGR